MTAVARVRVLLIRVMISRWVWALLLLAYAAALISILAPVLFASVGADDSYHVLQVPPAIHGSLWEAFWKPLSEAFNFGQGRSTSLSTSERQVVDLLTMKFATYFAIPPYFLWAAVKIGLLVLSVVSVIVFLRELRYRSHEGTVATLSAGTIAFIAICLPLTIAIGAKAQTVGTLNGWINYPTITYGPISVYLLIAALSLRLTRSLNRNYRAWVVPTVLILILVGFTVNLDYEFSALSIPLSVLLLILQPLPEGTTFWARCKGKLTALVALAGTYLVVFALIRWRISHTNCEDAGTCYAGTQIGISPKTLLYNIVGAFPGGTGAFTSTEAKAIGRPLPTWDSFSVTVAVLGVLVLVALLISWNLRHSRLSKSDAMNWKRSIPSELRQEVRGLLIVCAIALVMAVGSATISGISERAIEQVLSPLVPYRNGVVTWSAIAFFALAAVRLISLAPWRVVRYGVVIAFLAVLVVAVSLYLPRNIESAQANRLASGTQLIDDLQWQVALGDLSKDADAERCAEIVAYMGDRTSFSDRFVRSISGAYESFDFYYEQPYCSTGAGLATK